MPLFGRRKNATHFLAGNKSLINFLFKKLKGEFYKGDVLFLALTLHYVNPDELCKFNHVNFLYLHLEIVVCTVSIVIVID